MNDVINSGKVIISLLCHALKTVLFEFYPLSSNVKVRWLAAAIYSGSHRFRSQKSAFLIGVSLNLPQFFLQILGRYSMGSRYSLHAPVQCVQ